MDEQGCSWTSHDVRGGLDGMRRAQADRQQVKQKPQMPKSRTRSVLISIHLAHCRRQLRRRFPPFSAVATEAANSRCVPAARRACSRFDCGPLLMLP
ncbi:hypothetical protein AAFF_G00252370 [Aldrovandia affinis]|uniref:Uncharacterized protein n=1 Tax=Aldrovandia affinis TaxID=143900 RepID=A0AAD7STL0_9TELE|nr:hypothetical protein AAFF_G00252370 [Aldrovandia affinis]